MSEINILITYLLLIIINLLLELCSSRKVERVRSYRNFLVNVSKPAFICGFDDIN